MDLLYYLCSFQPCCRTSMKNYVFFLCATTPVIFIGNAFPFKSWSVKCLPFLCPFPSPSFTWFSEIEGQCLLLLMFCVIEISAPVLLPWKLGKQRLLVSAKGRQEARLYFFNLLCLLDLGSQSQALPAFKAGLPASRKSYQLRTHLLLIPREPGCQPHFRRTHKVLALPL